MTIEFTIDRLVLDGLDIPPGQRHLLQAAIEGELARLLRQNDVGARLQGGAKNRVRATDVTFSVGAESHRLGQQIAGSIFGSLTRPASAFADVPPANFPKPNLIR